MLSCHQLMELMTVVYVGIYNKLACEGWEYMYKLLSSVTAIQLS